MVLRWIRNALVLSLAALGMQSVRMIARNGRAGRRPGPARIPDGPLIVNGGTAPTRRASTLEPHGAL